MQKDDPLPAALNRILRLNWLHEDFRQQVTVLSQQVTPWPVEEITYLLNRAQDRKAKRAHNHKEPLGFFLAEILTEMARAFIAEAKRYWTISERRRFLVAYPLVLEQYLTDLDGRVPRARVLKCLSDATRLRQVHNLSPAEADEVCAEAGLMSASTYSNRRWDGVVLLAQAVKTAVEEAAVEASIHTAPPQPEAFCPEPALAAAAEEPVKYIPQPELSWLEDSGWVVDEAAPNPVETETALNFIEPNTIFWDRLLQTGRQVMVFNQAWVTDQVKNGLSPAAVEMQLRLMEERNLIRRVAAGSRPVNVNPAEIWYRVTDKSWRRLGVPTSRQDNLDQFPDQSDQMRRLHILPPLDMANLPVVRSCIQLFSYFRPWVRRSIPDRLRQLETGWQWDVGLGMAYFLLGMGLLIDRLSPYLVFSLVLILYWVWKYGRSRWTTPP